MAQDIELATATTLIQQTLNTYMLSIDKADVESLRTKVFHKDAKITLLQEVGLDDYCGLVSGIMKIIRTQHFLFNSVVQVDGTSATANSYFIGYHRVPAGEQGDACKALFGTQRMDTDSIIGGTYTDKLVLTPQGWRILVRNITLLWQHQTQSGELMKPDWLR